MAICMEMCLYATQKLIYLFPCPEKPSKLTTQLLLSESKVFLNVWKFKKHLNWFGKRAGGIIILYQSYMCES